MLRKRCAVRLQWKLTVDQIQPLASTSSCIHVRTVLCGNNGDSCWAKYGSYPLHRAYCHEMALRIVLAAIESAASRHKRHIVPVRACASGPPL